MVTGEKEILQDFLTKSAVLGINGRLRNPNAFHERRYSMASKRCDIFEDWLRRLGISEETYAILAGIYVNSLSTAVNRKPIVSDKPSGYKERLTITNSQKIIKVQLDNLDYIFMACDEARIFFDADSLTVSDQASLESALHNKVPQTYQQLSPEVLRRQLYGILDTLERIEKERDNRFELKTVRQLLRRFRNLLDTSIIATNPVAETYLQLSPESPEESLMIFSRSWDG